MLKPDALLVIDAIRRRGSYAAAAQELGRVPSALSYTVQKLEQELSVTLFRREGRRAVMTPAGRALADGAEKVLRELDLLVDRVRQTATGWEPALAIALDTTVDREPVWRAVNALYEEHPTIDLTLSEEVLGGTWEALFEDRVQLIIGAVENLPDQYMTARQGIRISPWRPVEMVFVAAPGHPICHAPVPLSAEDIQAHRGVVIADTSRQFRALNRGPFREADVMYVSNMQEKLAAHLSGIGIGLLPDHLARPHLESGDLIRLQTAGGVQAEPTVVAYRVENRGKALSCLVSELQSNL